MAFAAGVFAFWRKGKTPEGPSASHGYCVKVLTFSVQSHLIIGVVELLKRNSSYAIL
jgi:hypothetical protein